MQRSEQAAGQSIMRQIGNAIRLFTVENQGRLPSPVWPGQVAYYDPNEEERLVVQLAPFMDYPQFPTGQAIEAFAPPAFWTEVGLEQAETMRAYVIQNRIDLTDGSAPLQPFGLPEEMNDGEAILGMKLGSVISRIPDNTWLMSDADQLHPNVASAPWSNNTTETPFHGSSRNVLYWDGRVEAVAVE